MPKRPALIVALLLLTACTHRQTTASRSFWDPDMTVKGRAAELVVRDYALAHDPLLKDQLLHDTRYFTDADGKGGGYVVMTSAFGNLSSCGPRYTWLYHVNNGKTAQVFRYPFETTSVDAQGSAPVIHGTYWAYECTVCGDPRKGYMAQIPVKVFKKGMGWKIVPEMDAKNRPYLVREARLVVESAKAKYGPNDPEAMRMAQQLARFFPPINKNP